MRIRNIYLYMTYTLIFGFFFLIQSIFKSFAPDIFGNLFMITGCIMGGLALKKTGSIRFPIAILTSGIYVNIMLSSFMTGGIGSVSMVWIIFIPIIPGILAGFRYGAAWGGLSILSIITMYMLTQFGMVPDTMTAVYSEMDRMFNLIGVALATGALIHSYNTTGKKLISEMKKAKENAERCALEMETLARELESIFENSQVGIMLLKGGRFFAKGNQRLANILGYDTPDEMTQFSMAELHISEENFKEFGDKYYNNLTIGEQIQIEYQLRRKDNSPVWCFLSGKAIDKKRPPDLDKGVLWVIDTIEERKQLEFKLRKLATRDSLTGLYNRRVFMEHAAKEFNRSRRKKHDLSILMLDADHFKQINDTHGHSTGDTVLKSLAQTGTGCIREIDIFGRVGGEEFAVLLPETDLSQALQIGERIRKAIEEKAVDITPELCVSYTVSIGAACMDDKMTDVDDLLSRSDTALYAAKETGRNRVTK